MQYFPLHKLRQIQHFRSKSRNPDGWLELLFGAQLRECDRTANNSRLRRLHRYKRLRWRRKRVWRGRRLQHILPRKHYRAARAAAPMQTAALAAKTCLARASASEYTATEAIPRRSRVRIIRQAISPRLAIKTLLNIWVFV